MNYKDLPKGYEKVKSLNLYNDKLAMIMVTAFSGLLMLVMLAIGFYICKGEYISKYILVETKEEAVYLPTILFITVLSLFLYMFLRESVHICVIKLFCKNCKTKLKYNVVYCYTACSGYFKKSSYFAITFLPPILLGIVLVVFCFILPEIFFISVYAVLIMNVSSTAGDLYAAYIISKFDKESLIKDTGETVLVYSKV